MLADLKRKLADIYSAQAPWANVPILNALLPTSIEQRVKEINDPRRMAFSLAMMGGLKFSTKNLLPGLLDEIKSVGGKVHSDGTIELFHATTKEKAKEILKTGILKRPIDAPDSYGIFAGTNPSVTRSYGDGTVLKIRVPLKDISPDDIFPGQRMDFSIKTKQGNYRPLSINLHK